MNDPFYILAFLEHRGLDYQHRSLKDVWSFSDNQIERTHDFIQWVFPTIEPSQNVIGSPTLSPDELDLVSNSSKARDSLLKSSEWFLNFLSRNLDWTIGHDHSHNHLRITRMLRSLSLVGEKARAQEIYGGLSSKLQGSKTSDIHEKALIFWRRAIG